MLATDWSSAKVPVNYLMVPFLILSSTVLAANQEAFDQLPRGASVTRLAASGEAEAVFLPLPAGLAEGDLCAGRQCVVGCAGLPAGLRDTIAAGSTAGPVPVPMPCAAGAKPPQVPTWFHPSARPQQGARLPG